MSETVKHTPGKWRVEEGTTLVWGDCNSDDHSTRGMGYPIAEARINPSGNWSTGPYADEGEANARLIAAAPEMLEALKAIGAPDLVDLVSLPEPVVRGMLNAAVSVAQDAIAKAEGRQ